MQTKKNNSKVFYILIPLLFIIAAFFYDNILIIGQKKYYQKETEAIIKDVLTNSYNNKEEMVKKLYEEKNLETIQLNTRYENNILYVYNNHTFSAFFGYVFGIKSYRTEVNFKAYVDDKNEVKIEEIKEV